MDKRRIKVLILGHSDTEMSGHAYHYYKSLPEALFEKRLVVLDKTRDEEGYGYIYDLTNPTDVKRKKRNSYIQQFKIWATCGPVRGIKEYQGHNFYISEYNTVTAEQILQKVDGFIPDLILMMWVRTLVTPKAVKRLYDLTHAKFCFEFVDEGHLTGGCHYPIGCDHYLSGCHNCPALRWGKRIASKTMADKLLAYKGIPMYVSGSTFDCQLAMKSPLFQDATFFPYIITPNVSLELSEKEVAQQFWGIPPDSYVVLSTSGDVRKGLKYCLSALNITACHTSNICLLLLGKVDSNKIIAELDDRVTVITPGCVAMSEVYKAFCAADCFVSTTIADSGPMMVYYSVLFGVPVVLFNIGFAQDLIVHKKNGYIAKFMDSKDVAMGIDYFHEISTENYKEIKNFNKKLLEKFENGTQWYEKLYDDMQNHEAI